MMEMHSFLKAKQMEIPSPNGEENCSARSLLEFLYQMSEWIESVPLIYRRQDAESEIIYMWYDDVAFAQEDFWQMFGGYLALIDTRWETDIFGTSASSQETVWLTIKRENKRIYAVQNTLSGRQADTIQSLCLRIQCDSAQQSEILQVMLNAVNWKNGTAALDWKYGEFLFGEKLIIPTQNSCFCYAGVFDDVKLDDLLQALSFQQKVILWTGFLKDGFDYEEFEWLYDAISEDIVPNRIEWELALQTAMQNLGYSIKVSPNDFELRDGRGHRRYFNFNSTSYTERAFLKILFPLNI